MAKIIIELNFKNQPKQSLNLMVGMIKEQFKQTGLPAEDIKIKIEE